MQLLGVLAVVLAVTAFAIVATILLRLPWDRWVPRASAPVDDRPDARVDARRR